MLRSLLFLAFFTGAIQTLVQAADSVATTYGFNADDESAALPKASYTLKLLRVEQSKYQGVDGMFLFRHSEKKPLDLWGFGSEEDGSFRVRFEQFAELENGKWQTRRVLYCGTGAETFPLAGYKDYVLRVSLDVLKDSSSRGVVRLSGKDVYLFSDEFDCIPIAPPPTRGDAR